MKEGGQHWTYTVCKDCHSIVHEEHDSSSPLVWIDDDGDDVMVSGNRCRRCGNENANLFHVLNPANMVGTRYDWYCSCSMWYVLSMGATNRRAGDITECPLCSSRLYHRIMSNSVQDLIPQLTQPIDMMTFAMFDGRVVLLSPDADPGEGCTEGVAHLIGTPGNIT